MQWDWEVTVSLAILKLAELNLHPRYSLILCWKGTLISQPTNQHRVAVHCFFITVVSFCRILLWTYILRHNNAMCHVSCAQNFVSVVVWNSVLKVTFACVHLSNAVAIDLVCHSCPESFYYLTCTRFNVLSLDSSLWCKK